MARGRKKQQESAGAPMWMVTYGDLMTLLLTFFVLLLSFSTVVEEDFQEALASIRSEILFLDFQGKQQNIMPPVMDTFPEGSTRMRAAAQRIGRAAAALALEAEVRAVVEESEGLRITIQAPVLFDSGKAVLKPAGQQILRVILDEIAIMPNPLTIEGHTDNVPIHTPEFPSNWELSTARAIAVARFFMDSSNISPRRIGVAGYAEFRPLQSNTTPEGRHVNRRVELFIFTDASTVPAVTFAGGEAAPPGAEE